MTNGIFKLKPKYVKYIVNKSKVISSLKEIGISDEDIANNCKLWINRVDGKEAILRQLTANGAKTWVVDEEHIFVSSNWLDEVTES